MKVKTMRPILHKADLPELRDFLQDNGFTLLRPQVPGQYIWAHKPWRNHPFIVYGKYGDDVLIVQQRDLALVRAFKKSKAGKFHV